MHDLIDEAEADGTKVNNYALAKQEGIGVEQRNTQEEWDISYKRRIVSVAVSRKKKSGRWRYKIGSQWCLSELDLYKIRLLFAY